MTIAKKQVIIQGRQLNPGVALLDHSPAWHTLNFKEALVASVLFVELVASGGIEFIDLNLVERETRMDLKTFMQTIDSLLGKNLIRVNEEGNLGLEGDLLRLFNEEVLDRRGQ